MKKQVDQAGRVVLPKRWRDALGLEPGATVELTLEEGRVSLVPIPQFATLHHHDGFPTFDSGRRTTPADVQRDVEQQRAEREEKFLNPRMERATHG